MQENHLSDPPLNVAPARRERAVAVAIEADKDDPAAPPRLIASGRGKLAEEILALAFSHGIKVREDQGLAELLAQLDLDTPIPSEAIVAVAEILAKVYEANEAAAPHDLKGSPCPPL